MCGFPRVQNGLPFEPLNLSLHDACIQQYSHATITRMPILHAHHASNSQSNSFLHARLRQKRTHIRIQSLIFSHEPTHAFNNLSPHSTIFLLIQQYFSSFNNLSPHSTIFLLCYFSLLHSPPPHHTHTPPLQRLQHAYLLVSGGSCEVICCIASPTPAWKPMNTSTK